MANEEPQPTPRVRRTLEVAAEEARKRGHGYVGTEHLLLALIRDADGVAGMAVRKLGVEDALTAEVEALMEQPLTRQGYEDALKRFLPKDPGAE